MGQINLNKTWWGYGVKYGGIILAGAETTNGFIYNANGFHWREAFEMTNVRLGLGLGGSISAVGIFAFNTPSLSAIDGYEIKDWSISFAMGPKASVMFNSMKLAELTAENLGDIRLGLHYLYNELDIAKMGDTPKIVAVDIPGGYGAEISAHYVLGKFKINWGLTG